MLEKAVNQMIKTIHTTQGIQPKVTHIPVKYIRAINPFGEEVLVSEADMKRADALGLSLRRIEE